MLNYCIADINISISGIKIDKNYDRLKSFRINNGKMNYVKYKVKKVEELEFGNDKVYQESSFSIYKNKCFESRVFIGWNGEYAINSEDENGNYLITYKNDLNNLFSNELNLFNHMALEKVLIDYEAFILHSSFIKYNGDGILFTAPSGTGKSTQANLWKKYMKSEIINGDRTVLRKRNNKWYGYGFPYSGSSEFCKNDNAKIKAIVILEQSSTNSIRRCSLNESTKRILGEITVNYWNRNFVNKVIDLLLDLIQNVDVYVLSCRKDEGAVTILHNTIMHQE